MADAEIKINYSGINEFAGVLKRLHTSLLAKRNLGQLPSFSGGQSFEAIAETWQVFDETRQHLAEMVGAAMESIKTCGATFERVDDQIARTSQKVG
ncbi:MAG: hypothetical protein LBH87_02180 [Coriobacteriales bacterium]|jgi:uncharacterized protein YukE|nr:hypothetical protein [Coriobacteriales bacterium]